MTLGTILCCKLTVSVRYRVGVIEKSGISILDDHGNMPKPNQVNRPIKALGCKMRHVTKEDRTCRS
jgi:hypothetical protein